MQDFRKLSVWEKAHKLTLAVYEKTSRFPLEEKFGLIPQIRRASVSIPANIAEGCGKDGGSDLNRFLQISFGSACELEYHLLLSFDLGYLSLSDYKILENQVGEVKKMLSTLIRKIKTDN